MRHVPQKGIQHVPCVGAFSIAFWLSSMRIINYCGSTPQHLLLLLHAVHLIMQQKGGALAHLPGRVKGAGFWRVCMLLLMQKEHQ